MLEGGGRWVDRAAEHSGTIGSGHLGTSEPVIGFLGAGAYASSTLIPAFARTDRDCVQLRRERHHGHVFWQEVRLRISTTDASAVLNDPQINTLVIATRHDSHAQLL